MPEQTNPIAAIPQPYREEVERRLEPGESIISWFTPDLETDLQYASGLVLLTNRRVLASHAKSPGGPLGDWRSWPLSDVAGMKAKDRSGLGQVELLGPEGRLHQWRYTAAQSKGASRLAQRFDALQNHDALAEQGNGSTICPSCGNVYPAEELECPECAVGTEPQKTSGALLRLVKFAMARGKLIALGFGLTVAATARSVAI